MHCQVVVLTPCWPLRNPITICAPATGVDCHGFLFCSIRFAVAMRSAIAGGRPREGSLPDRNASRAVAARWLSAGLVWRKQARPR